MPTPTKRILAFSITTRKIYQRTPGEAWGEFPVQPPIVASAGTILIGLPNGSIIVWDGGTRCFWHWNPATETWINRGEPAGSPIATWNTGVAVGEDSAVAICEGYVARFNGATNTWTYLGYHAGIDDVAAFSLTDIWTVGRKDNINYAWHYDGADWVDLYPITPTLNSGDRLLGAVCIGGDAVFVTRNLGNPWGPSDLCRFKDGMWSSTLNFDVNLQDIWAADDQTVWFNCWNDTYYGLWKGADLDNGGTNILSGTFTMLNLGPQKVNACVKPFLGLDAQRVYNATIWAAVYIRETLNGGATWTLTTGYPSGNCSGLAIWTVDSGLSPEVVLVIPATDGQTGVSASADIVLDVYDTGIGLDPATVVIEIKIGNEAWVTIWTGGLSQPGYTIGAVSRIGGLRYTINPDVTFPDWTVIQLRTTAADLNGNSGTVTRSFRTRDILPPAIGDIEPAGTGISGSSVIRFALRDSQSGLKLSSLQMDVEVNAAPPVDLIVNGVVQTATGYHVLLCGDSNRSTVRVQKETAFSDGDDVIFNVAVEDNEVFT